MRLPRAVAFLKSELFGYFWLPCPVCGEMFGGHEAGRYGVWGPEKGTGRMVCNKPVCQAVAEKSERAGIARFWSERPAQETRET